MSTKKDLVKIRKKSSNINNFYSSLAIIFLQKFTSIWLTEFNLSKNKSVGEQNFSYWEDLPFSQITNLNKVKDTKLANYQVPYSEIFYQICNRTQLAIVRIAKISLSKTILIICYLVKIRSAITLALKSNFQTLRFEINHMSITIIIAMKNVYYYIILTYTNLC